MADFRIEPYTNMFGQVINPGDEVIYAGSGYNHNVKFNKGIYAGRYYQAWNGKPGAVKVEGVQDKKFKKDPITQEYGYVPFTRVAVLTLGRVFLFNTPMTVENLNKIV